MQKITTFLTYNDQAEEAARLYTSVFKNSKITKTTRYGEGAPVPKGTVMTVSFQIGGQEFVALNGGPSFKFAEGLSLYVDCETRLKSTSCGRSYPEAGARARADGSSTGSASPGK